MAKTKHPILNEYDLLKESFNKNSLSSAVTDIIPSLTVGKIKMATNPVNMGSVAVFYFVTICAIL